MMAKTYDYIIVGAGSAGCVLASRLTEDDGAQVLLLEAGERDWHPYIHIPLGMGKLHERRMFDWGFVTDPDPGLDARSLAPSRAELLARSPPINSSPYPPHPPRLFHSLP